MSHIYTVLRRIYYKTKLKIDGEGLLKEGEQQKGLSEVNTMGFRQYRLAMEMFVDLALNIGAKPILVTQTRLVHASNTPAQHDRIDSHHVGLVHEVLVETFDRLDAIVRKVATEKGAILIDASAQLFGRDWAFYDHVHFDREGRGPEAISQLIAGHIKEVLLLPTGERTSPKSTDLAILVLGTKANFVSPAYPSHV